MNDQYECQNTGDKKTWNRVYEVCFTYGQENVAMWGLYCVPWEDAAQLVIKKRNMLILLQSIDKVYGVKNHKITEELSNRFDKDLISVAYFNPNPVNKKDGRSFKIGDKSYHLSNKKIDMGMLLKTPILSGRVKGIAWEYEKEIRLIIVLRSKTNYEQIAIKIPDSVLKSMKIITGPSFDNQKLKKNEYKLARQIEINNSKYQSTVKLRNICDMCKYNFENK